MCVMAVAGGVLATGALGLERRVARTRAHIETLKAQAGRSFPLVSFAGAEGRSVTREELVAGHVTVLLFFSPSCDICRRELTALASATPAFGAGVRAVVVSVASERETRDFAASASWPFPVLWDRDRVFGTVFSGVVVPVVMVIDPRGTIAAVKIGGQRREDLIALANSAVPGAAPWLALEAQR